MNSAANQAGLPIDEIAWNYTLKIANMRYNEADSFCYDLYTKQRVGDARWVYPAAYAVAAIISKELFKKYGDIDTPVYDPESVMEVCGIHSTWKVNRFHKRLLKAVEKHRPKDQD